MSDYNQLMSDITNAEINKQELERQLDTLSKEYEMESVELRRLNDKNLEYTTALQNQEREKQLNDDRKKQENAKANLNAFVNELANSLR